MKTQEKVIVSQTNIEKFSKGNAEDTAERRNDAHTGFPKRVGAILN